LLDYGMRFALIATLPAMAVMGVLATPMVATLLQRGAFTGADALKTGPVVIAYAVGIVALVWIKILAPAFYAQQDTKTPVKIAVRVLIITQLFNLLFVHVVFERYAPDYKHAALALSISLGALLNAWWLYRGLRARGLYAPQAGWSRYGWQLFVATVCTAAVIFFAKPADLWWVTTEEIPRASMLAVLFALGGFTYLGVLYCFGFRPRDIRR
jgi:putative peptidoglycan lipid II flippase